MVSSSSTNFLATQVLNKTSGPLCVTYYTNVNVSVADSLHCRMICGTVPSYANVCQQLVAEGTVFGSFAYVCMYDQVC